MPTDRLLSILVRSSIDGVELEFWDLEVHLRNKTKLQVVDIIANKILEHLDRMEKNAD